jgi:hypothetical protein
VRRVLDALQLQQILLQQTHLLVMLGLTQLLVKYTFTTMVFGLRVRHQTSVTLVLQEQRAQLVRRVDQQDLPVQQVQFQLHLDRLVQRDLQARKVFLVQRLQQEQQVRQAQLESLQHPQTFLQKIQQLVMLGLTVLADRSMSIMMGSGLSLRQAIWDQLEQLAQQVQVVDLQDRKV